MSQLIESIEVPENVRTIENICPKKIEIYDDHIKAFGDRESSWFYRDFTGVTMQVASIFSSAYACIIFLNAESSQWNYKAGTSLLQDRNRIMFCSGMFKYKLANNFIASLLPKIQVAMEKYKMTSSETVSNNNINNAVEDIRKYKQLLDEGIITQEEFAAMKKQLLGL